ncbi:unnamed protein product [Oreochromis niloticus]|nr:unnamed protein product [Mustela putorius furo]
MILVILGVHSFRKVEVDSWQVREVEKQFPHPGYDRVTKVNDLMLLKLKEPVMLTKTVKCLRLGNTVKEPPAGSKCMVAGWGRTESNQPSDVLMSANVTVIDRQKCNSYYRTVITSDMICAGSTGKKKRLMSVVGIQEGHCCAMGSWLELLLLERIVRVKRTYRESTHSSQTNNSTGSKKQ